MNIKLKEIRMSFSSYLFEKNLLFIFSNMFFEFLILFYFPKYSIFFGSKFLNAISPVTNFKSLSIEY